MKKIISLIACITVIGLANAQSKSPKFNYENAAEQSQASEAAKAPGAPGDPVPIDAPLPILVAAALGLAVYFGGRKLKTA